MVYELQKKTEELISFEAKKLGKYKIIFNNKENNAEKDVLMAIKAMSAS